MHYLYAYMFLCHPGKGSLFSCGLQMTDTIGSHSCSDSNNSKVVLVGITGKVNCKNIRHDFIGFDRVLYLTGT